MDADATQDGTGANPFSFFSYVKGGAAPPPAQVKPSNAAAKKEDEANPFSFFNYTKQEAPPPPASHKHKKASLFDSDDDDDDEDDDDDDDLEDDDEDTKPLSQTPSPKPLTKLPQQPLPKPPQPSQPLPSQPIPKQPLKAPVPVPVPAQDYAAELTALRKQVAELTTVNDKLKIRTEKAETEVVKLRKATPATNKEAELRLALERAELRAKDAEQQLVRILYWQQHQILTFQQINLKAREDSETKELEKLIHIVEQNLAITTTRAERAEARIQVGFVTCICTTTIY